MRAALICALMLVGCESDSMKSVCGVRCTASGECPADYACRLDGRCYLLGAPAEQSCVIDGSTDGLDPPPTIINTTPQQGETEVKTSARVSVVFSEAVAGVDATSLRLTADEFHVPVSADVIYDTFGHVGTLVPSRPLRQATIYQVSVDDRIHDGAFQRLMPLQWSFMTAVDEGPPTVTSVVPANGAIGVDLTSPIHVAFSEEVSGISPSSFYVADPDGPLAGTFGVVTQTSVSLTTAVRKANTAYSIHLTPAISDFAGNPLSDAPLVFYFSTGSDTSPPTIIAQTPAPNNTNIPRTISISVRFSEPVIGASASTLILEQAGAGIAGTVTYFPATRVARLTPTAPLLSHTLYAVKVTSGITDIAGNPVTSGVIVWAFTTGE